MRHLMTVVQCLGVVGLVSCSGGNQPSSPSQKITKQPEKKEEKTEGSPTPVVEGSHGMKWVHIQPGKTVGKLTFPKTFQMGSPASEADRDDDETQHEVTLTKSFEIMTTEVTQQQWFDVMGLNPSEFSEERHCEDTHKKVKKDGKEIGLCPNHPVEKVSWKNIAGEEGFLKKLNVMEKDDGYTYRLPTEAEWEYAARAGTKTAYSFGDEASNLKEYGWYGYNSGNQTYPIGTKKANDWGLYDMHGNVWEWVQDWYKKYPKEAMKDPTGPDKGTERALRGGSWVNSAGVCRSAIRDGDGPSERYYGSLGFRLVRAKK